MNAPRHIARRAAVALFALVPFAPPARASEPHEPTADYYGAKGRGIGARWDAPQQTVQEGRDLVAALVVTGAMNPAEVKKPDLKALPSFNNFVVTDVPDAPRAPDDRAIRFNYKLRPRNRAVEQIPALKFYYLNPAAAPGKSRFPHTYADSVPIRVTEPPPKVPEPMADPDHLFGIASGPGVLSGPFVPCRWAWGAAALFGPLVALGWFLLWRRVYPDAQRLAQMRRSRAARRALDAIRKAGRTPDPPATIAGALLAYLRARFPLPESAVTPPEVAAALVEAQVPTEIAARVADAFRGCDRARFAPPNDSGSSLAADAEAAVARLEELA